MRIIGGTHKSRKINAPKNLPLRPTTDFAKESLFNILENRMDLEGAEVLDLFSGTGAISLEFASRGAGKVISIDKNPSCTVFLKQKAKEFGFEQIIAQKGDALRTLEDSGLKFDVVFADPPYEYPKKQELVDLVLSSNILKPNGLFIIEHDSKTRFSDREQFLEQRTYGAVNFSFFSPRQS